jgi:hypothetical protein
MQVFIVLEQWYTGSTSGEFEANSHVARVFATRDLAEAYVEKRLEDAEAGGEDLEDMTYGFEIEEHEVTT